jgi:hypothetical protein
MPLKVLEQTLGDVRLERNEQAFRPRRQNTLDVLRIVRYYQRFRRGTFGPARCGVDAYRLGALSSSLFL